MLKMPIEVNNIMIIDRNHRRFLITQGIFFGLSIGVFVSSIFYKKLENKYEHQTMILNKTIETCGPLWLGEPVSKSDINMLAENNIKARKSL